MTGPLALATPALTSRRSGHARAHRRGRGEDARAIDACPDSERYGTDVALDGVTGLALAASRTTRSIVLDRMLPDLDGIEVLRLLRGRGRAGARPHAHRPGHARPPRRRPRCGGRRLPRQAVRLLRDAGPHPRSDAAPASNRRERLGVGDISCSTRSASGSSVGERAQELSAREFALLGYLIRHAAQVVTRRQILDAVWGADPDVYSNVVDLYVHYLRGKLEVLGAPRALRTVRGVGYSCDR